MKWTEDQLNDLRNNRLYYLKNKKEAETHFKRCWSSIRNKAIKLELSDEITNIFTQLKEQRNKQYENENIQYKKEIPSKKIKHQWSEEEIKMLKSNYQYYLTHKKEAESFFGLDWIKIQNTAIYLKITSMKTNKNCAQFLGCHVAERVLSHVFKDVKRMPYNNKGYDFVCNKGFKIEVKSSCLNKNNRYTFQNLNNKTANYFLLITFDNRKDLNPQHIWLIKSDEILNNYKEINKYKTLILTNTEIYLSKYSKYELTDKLKETIECCSTLKSINKSKEEVT